MTVLSPWTGRHGPLLIAEIGGNHEGDFAYACQLADLAIATGVDYVKFQLYRGDTLVSPFESPDRHAHFQRFELTREQHRALAERCRSAGVGYLASVWDLDLLDWVDEYLDIYKIGSGDLTAYPVLAGFAQRGKPMILSTGLADLGEVRDAVRFIQSVNPVYEQPGHLALLQCTSMYPIAEADANLAVMDTLRAATGLAVGYSDHTEGCFALSVAAARGAQILEFHFTDCREGKTFRDHRVSLTPSEVRDFVAALERLRSVLGDGVKRPLPVEVDAGHLTSFRRAVYCRRSLRAGEVVPMDDLVCLRPNHGVDARNLDALSGAVAARDLAAFEALVVDTEIGRTKDGGR